MLWSQKRSRGSHISIFCYCPDKHQVTHWGITTSGHWTCNACWNVNMSSKDAKFGKVSPFNSNQFEFVSDHETLMKYIYQLCHSLCQIVGTWQSEVILIAF